MEQHLAGLIFRSLPYQSFVVFVEHKNLMETKVCSRTDAVTDSDYDSCKKHTRPSCCVYSKVNDGFPFLHVVAVICEKHGSVSLHKFISKRHLSSTCKLQYADLDFLIPEQAEMDKFRYEARLKVQYRANIHISVAFPTPEVFHRRTARSDKGRYTNEELPIPRNEFS